MKSEGRSKEPSKGLAAHSGSGRVSRRVLLRNAGVAAAGLALTPLALAACGADNGAARQSTPSNSSGKTGGGGTHGSSSGNGGNSATQSLNVGTLYALLSFDPYTWAQINSSVAGNLNTPSLYYDNDYKPVPQVASGWSVSDDHRSVTVSLRQGLKYHTGATIKAADAVNWLDRGLGDNGATFGAFTGVAKSAEALSDKEFKISFKKPLAESLITDFLLALPIVDPAKNTVESLKTTPAGAGPFVLDEYKAGVSVSMKPFSGFWDTNLPHLDSLKYSVFGSMAAMGDALRSGAIDVVAYATPILASSLTSDFTVFERKANLSSLDIRINTTAPPFDNKVLRKALQRAVDRDRIVKDVMHGFSDPEPLGWIPGSQAFDGTYLDSLNFDLDEAEKLLKASGAPKTGEAIVDSTNEDFKSILQIIKSDLAKIGFNLELKALDAQTFSLRARTGKFQMTVGGAGANLRNPSSKRIAMPWYVDDNPLWGGKPPRAYVEAMDGCASALTEDDLASNIKKLNAAMAEEAWIIGICTKPQLFVAKKDVQHFIPDSYGDKIDQRQCQRS